MDHKKVLSVVCILMVSVAGEVLYDRPCRTDVAVLEGFCLDRYLGKWYEIQRYDQDFQINFDCVQAQYGLLDDSSASVRNTAYNLFNDTAKEAIGRAILAFPENELVPAKLNVSFFGAPNDRANYWILDTDYENYSVIWSCEPLPEDTSREYFWLLSRTRQFTDDEQINEKVNHLIEKYVDQGFVRETNQLDERCPDF